MGPKFIILDFRLEMGNIGKTECSIEKEFSGVADFEDFIRFLIRSGNGPKIEFFA